MARRSATRLRSTRVRAAAPLAGFKQVQPRVFAGVFPVNTEDYESFRDALAKLKLNDSALHYEPEVSTALGFGFRCGFLGPAAHGYRAGAPGARIQPRPDHQRTDRGVRNRAHRRHAGICRQPGQTAAEQRDRGSARTDHHGEYPVAARSRRRGDQAVYREARSADQDAVRGQPGVDAVRDAAGGGGARLLRPAEVGEPRLCFVRL